MNLTRLYMKSQCREMKKLEAEKQGAADRKAKKSKFRKEKKQIRQETEKEKRFTRLHQIRMRRERCFLLKLQREPYAINSSTHGSGIGF